MVKESLKDVVLAKETSQPQSSYEATATLIEFELKKILIDKMDKMYSLKRNRKDKDKDEDPSTRSDRGLKKRKTSKDAEPTKGPKAKESQSGSSKGTKSQSKSSRKSVQSEEPDFEVAGSDMPQDQEKNLSKDDEEPKELKRANIMIKAIDKQLKERRLMRSLKKFVGGRHYGTDLRLLQ
ncbi:hypothetical protein Tco_0186534 [Tanacetum coccineum]